MPITNTLLVYKKSIYQMFFIEKKHDNNPGNIFSEADIKRFYHAHQEHYKTLDTVRYVLTKKGMKFQEIYRAQHIDYSPFDLIISVGGDGTFLEAARGITVQLILGVNSDPERSVGNFLPATSENFSCIISSLQDYPIKQLHRMKIKLNDTILAAHILNDVLICHRHPGAMTRYAIGINYQWEEQDGSGVWLSTAAGSSGGILAAGGKKMPLESQSIQYKIRELFHGRKSSHRYTGGILDLCQFSLRFRSRISAGMIYIDGSHFRFHFPYGNILSVENSPFPLHTISTQSG